MNDIDKKISELYDGELDHDEIESLLEIISADPELQKKLSMYSLAGIASDFKTNEVASINSNDRSNKNIFSNIWLSNSLTAAASVLLTLTIVNNADFSRMDISSSSTNQISSAINSKEAKEVINLSLIHI